MPIIHEYTADAQPGGPIETRQARPMDTGEVGNALSRFGSAVSDVGDELHKRDAQSEISSLNAQIAEAHANFTDGLDDTLQNADPNDRNIADKFMQGYDDRMDEIADNIQTPEGQAYFEKANAQMRAHFQVAAHHGQALLAGQNAVDNYNTQVDQYSASLMKDPSSFDQVREQNGMAIQAMVDNGTVPQAKADELVADGEEKFAKSAVRGWIQLDPQGALKQINDGKWDDYVSGDLKYQLQKEAEQGIRGQQIENKRIQDQQDQIQQAKIDTQQNQFLSRMQDPQNPLTTKDVLNSDLPAFGTGSKEQFLKMIDAQSKGFGKKDDPATVSDLWDRIHLPDGDPRKITDPNVLNQYVSDGKLSYSTLKTYRSEMTGAKTPDGQIEQQLKTSFLAMAKNDLAKPNALGLRDPSGLQNYLDFQSHFLSEYQKQRAAGKPASALLSPSSPDYMGKMLDAFRKTPDQIMNDMAKQYGSQASAGGSIAPTTTATQNVAAPPNNVRVAVEPRRKGETPDQYLTRTKKKD